MKRIKESIKEFEFDVLINFVTNNDKMRQNTKDNYLKAFTLLFYSGARLNELTQITNKDILSLIKNKELIIKTHKTKSERKIYFSDKAVKHITKLFKEFNIDIESEQYKIIRVKGNPYTTPSPIAFIQQTNKIIQSVLGKRYTSHSFRQGLITELGTKGVNPKIIKEFMGHKDIKTTMRYIKPNEEDIRNSLTR